MLSVREQLPGISGTISISDVAGDNGYTAPFSVRKLLLLNKDVVLWRGFKHKWEYNHRLNRMGSYLLHDGVNWTIGHAAASGTGADTAHIADLYSVVKSPHVSCLPGETDTPDQRSDPLYIDTPKSSTYTFEKEVRHPLPPFGEDKTYTVVLNGFDLWATNDANKLMEFALTVDKPSVIDSGDSLSFKIKGRFKGDCDTVECEGIPVGSPPPVRYKLKVYYLIVVGDSQHLNATRTSNATNRVSWRKGSGGGAVGVLERLWRSLLTGGRARKPPAREPTRDEDGQETLQVHSESDDSRGTLVTGLHHLSIDVNKDGGGAMHMLQWDTAIIGSRSTTDSVIVELLLFFKNWTRGMASSAPPQSWAVLRDAGSADLEVGVTLLNCQGVQEYKEKERSGTIPWNADAPASSERAVSEQSL